MGASGTTLSSTVEPRACIISYFQKPGLQERAGEVLPMDEPTGLDTWDLFFVPRFLGLLVTRVFIHNFPR